MEDTLKTDCRSHLGFGENWRDFAKAIDDEKIARAEQDMRSFLQVDSLAGQRILDIGCGSGLHALCAARLGAQHVTAVDIDPVSVETAETVFRHYWHGQPPEIKVASVFDTTRESWGDFDLVYSWGVLHHTGGMWEAIRRAAALVKPGGRFAIALYVKTPLCGFWKVEKRLYTASPAAIQSLLTWIYVGMHGLRDLLRGRNPIRRFKRRMAKTKGRGMDYLTDKRDWLGGYPYESATPGEVTKFVEGLGFRTVHVDAPAARLGVFGATNAEYLFESTASPQA